MSRAPRTLGRAPLGLVLPAALAAALLVVPLVTLVLDTPWGSFVEQLGTTAVRDALWLTVLASAVTVVACLLLGTPLAWLLARVDFPGRSLLRAAVAVPLVLPPVVAGVALVTALGRNGLIGSVLRDATGLTLPYTTAAVVIAHTFVSLPFYVLSVEGALRASGERYDVVAATLGADRWTTFRRITLPLALPGVLAGSVLGLGPLAGRVRRHHHLRRQLPRHHADDAVADLPGAAVRPGGRPHAQHDPAGRLGGHARRAAQPLADHAVSVRDTGPGTGAPWSPTCACPGG